MQLLNSNLLFTYFSTNYEHMSVDVIPLSASFLHNHVLETIVKQLVVCNERAYGSDTS